MMLLTVVLGQPSARITQAFQRH